MTKGNAEQAGKSAVNRSFAHVPTGDFNVLLQIIKKNFKKIKKVLDFFVIIGYNNFCAVEEIAKQNRICAISSVGRAPDS